MIVDIEENLKKSISEKRFDHSLRVMEEAKRLAKHYNENIEKASIAALLHDCGRFEDKEYLLKKADEFDIITDDIYKKNVNLIHSYLGSEIAKKNYAIDDEDILNAIRYHTTGRANMSMLEKIVYMADYIEPARSFNGVEEVRTLSYSGKNIDQALIKAIDNTIIHIVKSGLLIHEDTIKARNFLLHNK